MSWLQQRSFLSSISLSLEMHYLFICIPSIIPSLVKKFFWSPSGVWGFPGGSDGRESACRVGDQGLIPGSWRSAEEGNGHPLQYSCLENSTGRGAWWATVHGVAKSQTRLSNSHFQFHFADVWGTVRGPKIQWGSRVEMANWGPLGQIWLSACLCK